MDLAIFIACLGMAGMMWIGWETRSLWVPTVYVVGVGILFKFAAIIHALFR